MTVETAATRPQISSKTLIFNHYLRWTKSVAAFGIYQDLVPLAQADLCILQRSMTRFARTFGA
jgi:hypothetical protein